jgi:hypothetical protein
MLGRHSALLSTLSSVFQVGSSVQLCRQIVVVVVVVVVVIVVVVVVVVVVYGL